MDERIDLFRRFVVLYDSGENEVGIKGIRGDAPEEAIEAFIDWYRDKHRYPNGRMLSRSSKRIRSLIIPVDKKTVPESLSSGQSSAAVSTTS